NYIASWRDLNQVTAIDSQTGEVVWRMGGVRGEYTFMGDARNGFSKQHYSRVLPNGNLLVYDNGNDATPRVTRAVEYRVDHVAKTAQLVWEYQHRSAFFTPFVGNADRLQSGNTWVSFGARG